MIGKHVKKNENLVDFSGQGHNRGGGGGGSMHFYDMYVKMLNNWDFTLHK